MPGSTSEAYLAHISICCDCTNSRKMFVLPSSVNREGKQIEGRNGIGKHVAMRQMIRDGAESRFNKSGQSADPKKDKARHRLLASCLLVYNCPNSLRTRPNSNMPR